MSTGSARSDRKRARAAIAATRLAEREARRLERSLPDSRRRRRLSKAIETAAEARRAAEVGVRTAPRASMRRAARATARMEHAARGLIPDGGDGGDGGDVRAGRRRPAAERIAPGAAADLARARARARELKARRKQFQRVQGWAKKAAAMVLAQSIMTPTDAESARAARRRAERRRTGGRARARIEQESRSAAPPLRNTVRA